MHLSIVSIVFTVVLTSTTSYNVARAYTAGTTSFVPSQSIPGYRSHSVPGYSSSRRTGMATTDAAANTRRKTFDGPNGGDNGRRTAASSSSSSALHSSSTSALPDVSSMRVGEIKGELESYGISTKIFLEKSELVEALCQARDEGRTTTTTSSSSVAPPRSSQAASSAVGTDTNAAQDGAPTREERLAREIESCGALKVRELKGELASLGIATHTFFEKSEFVRALAEARVDGVTVTTSTASQTEDDEGYVEYAEVEVLPSDGPDPRRKSDGAGAASADAGAGGMGGMADMLKNMGGLGGMADMMGGMGGGGGGGMGGMADMLKNMGGMGGMADMMGGMGGNMGKAQELMQNPKVMAVIQKAQGNPKIMQAVMECMSNPAAMMKYQNDPDVMELMNELREFM